MTNDAKSAPPGSEADISNWKEIVARYQKPSVARSVWQIVNTVVPYIGIWALMYVTVQISWWLTIPLAILAGGFMVRMFIIFHDCGHSAYFKSQKANHFVGAITGVLTFTP